MKLFVKVKPNAKQEKIIKINESHFDVWVKEPPKGGIANRTVLKVMAEYFKIPKSCLAIVSGQSSKQKVLEIV